MNEANVERIQNDLLTMRQALGLAVPPVSRNQVWGMLWLAACGLLLVLLSAFPRLIPQPWGTVLFLAGWLALPTWGYINRLRGKSGDVKLCATASKTWLYSAVVVAVGITFAIWARTLGLPWPIIVGGLFFVEGLPCLVVAILQPWRLSLAGWAIALIVCGLCVPFMRVQNVGVLLGGIVFLGWFLSAAILCWQLRRHEAEIA
jgi:hypothetical protein